MPTETECWVWNGELIRGGYGRKRVAGGKRVIVHRAMWEEYTGRRIPDGMVVMHTCDNPACYNPAHLSLGTQQDNIRDCMAKGRAAGIGLRGEESNAAKLTEKQVLEIRADYAGKQHSSEARRGPTMQQLAEKHGVSRKQIANVLTGYSWSHL